MNKKRFVAVLAAAVMLVSAVPVYATETTPQGTVVTDTATNITITGDATINDFDKTPIYKVTLPTNNSLDFIVDPHGLVNLASGESAEVDITATGEGAIISNGVAFIKNESSEDIVVTTTFTVNAPGVTLMDEDDAIAVDDEMNMLLVAVPSATKPLNEDDYVATGKAIALEASTTAEFKLNKASYVVTNENGAFKYEIDDTKENNFDATAFKIGGKVNKQADWNSVTASAVSINAVFAFDKADGTEELAPGVYGVVDTTTVIDYAPAAGSESAKAMNAAYASTITLTPVEGETFAETTDKTNAKITVNGKEVVVYAASESKVTFKESALETALERDVVEGEELTIVLTDGDGVKYTAKCTVK